MGTRLVINGADFSDAITPTLDVFISYNAVKGLLSIVCEDFDPIVKIYYTEDGSEPTNTSTLYTGPITLRQSAFTVKAVAYKNGIKGQISTFDYTNPFAGISWRNGFYSYVTGKYLYDSVGPKYKTVQQHVPVDVFSAFSKIKVNDGYVMRVLCFSSAEEGEGYLGFSSTVTEYSFSQNKPNTTHIIINISYNPASDISDIDAAEFVVMSGLRVE